jgi:sensor histidine kinase YesM
LGCGGTSLRLERFTCVFLSCSFLWYLKGPILQKVFAFSFQWITTIALWYLAESITSIFISMNEAYFTRILFIEMLVVYTTYAIFMVKFSKRLMNRMLNSGNKIVWLLYSAGAVYSFVFLTISRDFPGSLLQYILLIIFVLWSFVILCVTIINTHEKVKQKNDAELARSIIAFSRDRYHKMNEMYDKLRILRHDYKYHLNAVRKMIRSGDTDKADNYLKDVESQMSETEIQKYCENAVINALVASYAERSLSLDIRFNVNVVFAEELSIPNYDMCIVLGNLLENALEACTKLKQNRFIELETKNRAEQLLVMVKNSFDGLIHGKDGLMTNPKANRGLGLRSVQEVIEHHGGDLLTEWNSDTFTAYATIKTEKKLSHSPNFSPSP